MFFRFALYFSLSLFGAGLVYKLVSWFRCPIGDQSRGISPVRRFSSAVRGLTSVLFSRRILLLGKIFFGDILLLLRLKKEGSLRWFMHLALFYGFLFLLFFHALDRHITIRIFPEYVSTLNPFLFLRNFFGALLLLGLAIAGYRRFRDKVLRLTTGGQDIFALVLLGVIILSGFILEASKIVSPQRFQEMVQEYGTIQGDLELRALRAYWARDFGVVFSGPETRPDQGLLKKGGDLHDLNCAQCHSRPATAFVSYGIAKAFRPLASTLTDSGISTLLWYLHFLSCFLGLAVLPFTKFFHIFTSPLILLINGVTVRDRLSPADLATIQAIELDACTHCAICSQHCSVRPISLRLGNPYLLSSEKLIAFKSLARQKNLPESQLKAFQEGNSLCTGCYRGNLYCPIGINTLNLWSCMQQDLAHSGCPDLFSSTRDAFVSRFDPDRSKAVVPLAPEGKAFKKEMLLSSQGSSFNPCFTCLTCSNSCPVVMNYPNPIPVLGLLPHQIMYSLKFGLTSQVLGARMVWDCLGCYQCQENCPQGVRVTDILFELKSFAFQHLKTHPPESGLPGGSS
jgi:heterodisulfide reductase subunit C